MSELKQCETKEPCGSQLPYEEEIYAGGVLCGGCGRSRPNVKYRLVSPALGETGMAREKPIDNDLLALKEFYDWGRTRIKELEAQIETWKYDAFVNMDLQRVLRQQVIQQIATITELQAQVNTMRENIAQWMIRHEFATGHGDTVEDLFRSLDEQIGELRSQLQECREEEKNKFKKEYQQDFDLFQGESEAKGK